MSSFFQIKHCHHLVAGLGIKIEIPALIACLFVQLFYLSFWVFCIIHCIKKGAESPSFLNSVLSGLLNVLQADGYHCRYPALLHGYTV